MFDYFIQYAYKHISWVKDLIANRPIDSPNLHFSRYSFSKEVNENILDSLLENNTFLSLTYRIKYPKYSVNGNKSYYTALLNKYNINYDENPNGGCKYCPFAPCKAMAA